jgi:hypothetical protein
VRDLRPARTGHARRAPACNRPGSSRPHQRRKWAALVGRVEAASGDEAAGLMAPSATRLSSVASRSAQPLHARQLPRRGASRRDYRRRAARSFTTAAGAWTLVSCYLIRDRAVVGVRARRALPRAARTGVMMGMLLAVALSSRSLAVACCSLLCSAEAVRCCCCLVWCFWCRWMEAKVLSTSRLRVSWPG